MEKEDCVHPYQELDLSTNRAEFQQTVLHASVTKLGEAVQESNLLAQAKTDGSSAAALAARAVMLVG